MSSSKPTQLTPFSAALAGALGGCFSNAVVYPLDVAKTRIQAATDVKEEDKDKLSVLTVLYEIFKEEGLGGLYGGFGATMLNTFSMQYAYFFFYSFVRTSYIKRASAKLPKGAAPVPLSTAAELMLGAVAGALAQIFTIPVSVIATRQQVGNSKRKASRALQGTDTEKGQTKAEDEAETYDDSFLGVAKEIIEEEGVTGLWLGIKPGLVLTVNPAITYGLYERVKGIVLLAKQTASGGSSAANEKLSPWMTFVIGAMSKTLATIVTYPYIMAKVRIQARSADVEDALEEHHPKPQPHHYHHDKYKHAGALDILARVWRKQGFVGWYQVGDIDLLRTIWYIDSSYKGMEAQITKAVISQALLFLSKEQFEQWTLMFMVLLWRLRRRAAV
ncbi:mitochondrial carrier [Panus rudis PR-1116 ss-1]|nr:mitochondrial carrier [Panus rudis PR-1116 ss-1]